MIHRRILAIAAAALASAAVIVTAGTSPAVGPANVVADDTDREPGRYLSYAVLGDSITVGMGTSDWAFDASGAYVRVDHRWAYGEQAGLRSFGVNSSCVAGDFCAADPADPGLKAQRWFPDVMRGLHRLPHTVVTHIGINDLAADRTAEEVIAGLHQLRREGRRLGIRVVFGTVAPSPADAPTWTGSQPERLRVNEWIRNTQSSYVDYARALEGADGWLRPEFESSFHDVHINDAGAAAMAAAVREWVAADAAAQSRARAHG
jgi:lysophospholipase L1-like esterase